MTTRSFIDRSLSPMGVQMLSVPAEGFALAPGAGPLGPATPAVAAFPGAGAHPAPGLTLPGSAVEFVVFGGLLIPVLAPLSTLALAVGYAWVGASPWAGRTGEADGPAGERPPSAAGVGHG
jgi:hypothetical protein